jgi:hypothetical protein
VITDHAVVEQLPKKSSNPEFYAALNRITKLRPRIRNSPFLTILKPKLIGLKIEQLPYCDFLTLITITLQKAVVLSSKETVNFLSHKNIFTHAFVSIDNTSLH